MTIETFVRAILGACYIYIRATDGAEVSDLLVLCGSQAKRPIGGTKQVHWADTGQPAGAGQVASRCAKDIHGLTTSIDRLSLLTCESYLWRFSGRLVSG